ncbi:pentatricopeptide repeat (PPR) superfamily protein [Artemisia annua]|uniref:Pentatricopeptide repeat (PPR) superfamily protein n=2 Tax=Artemisia annua TaxID=35608 RepID=A0A2U1MKF7_ARTAN|nr:pentatricopeptide repeat (PPR) superfamily protein [Artemisia annua]
MRNQLRLLLQRCKPIPIHHHFTKVQQQSLHSLPISHKPHFQTPPYFPKPFSSLAINQTKQSDITSSLIELYSDPHKTHQDTLSELKTKHGDSLNEHVRTLFSTRGSDPNSPKLFYDYVVSNGIGELSSNSFNRLLGMLGGYGLVKEFWELVEVMGKRGYGVKKGAAVRVMEKFVEMGLDRDVEKLKGLFKLGSGVGKVGARVSKVVRGEPWGEAVEKKLLDMGVVFTSELVKLVLENLGTDGNKAVIFFRWVEESGLFKHDEATYNALLRELGREEYVDKFWRVVGEMKDAGFEMEKGCYVLVLRQFVKKRMLKDAVDLYEFAMGGKVKPSLQDCVYLLRKIVTSSELDMELVSKVLRVYKESGNKFSSSELNTVLKSLTSVGRYSECNKILRAMEDVGFYPDEKMQGKIGFQLSKDGKTEEASEFVDFVEGSGTVSSYKTYESLIDGYCISGHLDKAADCFQTLLKNGGASSAGYALETLTNVYCSKGKADEAYRLLLSAVYENNVKPWHTTYKLLISKLLEQGLFNKATDLFGPMKADGYPPYLSPFVKYVSKTGTTDETLMFLTKMTDKKVPSINVYTRVFKAYFKAGRHSEAQDFLSKCPGFIKNHVDVLNLFYSMKRVKDTAASTPVAA